MTYSAAAMDHFNNPRNVGVPKEFTVKGKAGNPNAGLFMVIYLLVKNGTIEQAGFQTFGCAAAIACGSLLTEMVKGLNVPSAAQIQAEEILRGLGGLPLGKQRCATIAIDALYDCLRQT